MKNFINNKLLKDILPQTIKWYKYLHENPELSYKEINTSNYIYEEIKAINGVDELVRPTKTSIMAKLIGKEKGKTIALRADMDALPISEQTDLPYKSRKDGVMHACGHDAHTAMLLTTLKLLASMKDKLQGEVRFLFQHAEEVCPGGATEMFKAGVLNNVNNIFAYHVYPSLKTGTFGYKNRFFCASADSFKIEVLGKGGHASMPHLTTDPIVIASNIVMNLQNIVSRHANPTNIPVISIGSFNSGSAYNIIPDDAVLLGTLRALGNDVRNQSKDLIYNIVDHITKAHNANYKITWEEGEVAGYNDDEATSMFLNALGNVVSKENIIDLEYPMYAGEDFSIFLEQVKGCMIMIGIGNEDKQTCYPLHSNKFKIDFDAFQYGIAGFIELIKQQCFKP